jgi:hypothetical protein
LFYTVYQITNTLNDKIYIGAHKTKKLDDGYMGSGKHIVFSQEKYGLENFKKEILHTFSCSADMFLKEKELVDEHFIKRKDTYNIKLGGSGGFDHLKDYIGSDNHLKQLSGVSKLGSKAGAIKIKFLSKNDPEWTKQRSENLSIGVKKAYLNGFEGGFKNKAHSEATKQKMRDSKKGKHIGKKNSQYGTMWITNGIDNKKILKNEPISNDWKKGRTLKK